MLPGEILQRRCARTMPCRIARDASTNMFLQKEAAKTAAEWRWNHSTGNEPFARRIRSCASIAASGGRLRISLRVVICRFFRSDSQRIRHLGNDNGLPSLRDAFAPVYTRGACGDLPNRQTRFAVRDGSASQRGSGPVAGDEIDAGTPWPPSARPQEPLFSDEEFAPAPTAAPDRAGPETAAPEAAVSDAAADAGDWDSDSKGDERLYRFGKPVHPAPGAGVPLGRVRFSLCLLRRAAALDRHVGGHDRCCHVADCHVEASCGLLSNEGASYAMIVGIATGLFTLFFSLFVYGYITASSLAVIEDTASGCDTIQDWPESDWLSRVFALRYLVAPVVCAMLAASGVRQLAGEWNAAAGAAAFLVLPILLLSVLEPAPPGS